MAKRARDMCAVLLAASGRRRTAPPFAQAATLGRRRLCRLCRSGRGHAPTPLTRWEQGGARGGARRWLMRWQRNTSGLMALVTVWG